MSLPCVMTDQEMDRSPSSEHPARGTRPYRSAIDRRKGRWGAISAVDFERSLVDYERSRPCAHSPLAAEIVAAPRQSLANCRRLLGLQGVRVRMSPPRAKSIARRSTPVRGVGGPTAGADSGDPRDSEGAGALVESRGRVGSGTEGRCARQRRNISQAPGKCFVR
jgi:hypothetical protein